MSSTSKIAKNSLYIYIKVFFSAITAFYTTRVFISILGADDYGLYGLIGGLVSMLAFVNVAMAVTTQRYLSVGMGEFSLEKQKSIFASSLAIHLIIATVFAVVLVVFSEIILLQLLSLPEDKINIARILYYLAVASVFIMIVRAPFDGVLVSNENMLASTIVGISLALAKMGLALSLPYYNGSHNSVVVISTVIFVVTLLLAIGFIVFTSLKYSEVSFNLFKYVKLDKCSSMLDFAKWNLFGSISGLARTQGLNIILNMFFAMSVNAAYAVANQINTQVLFFSQSILGAITPRIMQQEGAGDRQVMIEMSMFSSKIAFFILSVIILPIYWAMPTILELWLTNVPEYTLEFIRLFLIVSLVGQLTVGLQIALQAHGKIKLYYILLGVINLSVLPVSYLLLRQGESPEIVLVVMVILETLSVFVRVVLAKMILNISIAYYFKSVILRLLSSLILPITLLVNVGNFNTSIMMTIVISIISIILTFICFYALGLTTKERMWVNKKMYSAKKLIKD